MEIAVSTNDCFSMDVSSVANDRHRVTSIEMIGNEIKRSGIHNQNWVTRNTMLWFCLLLHEILFEIAPSLGSQLIARPWKESQYNRTGELLKPKGHFDSKWPFDLCFRFSRFT
jgi:hypothetical protein